MEFAYLGLYMAVMGIIAETIAKKKGISGFLWGFCLGPIGVLFVLLSDNLASTYFKEYRNYDLSNNNLDKDIKAQVDNDKTNGFNKFVNKTANKVNKIALKIGIVIGILTVLALVLWYAFYIFSPEKTFSLSEQEKKELNKMVYGNYGYGNAAKYLADKVKIGTGCELGNPAIFTNHETVYFTYIIKKGKKYTFYCEPIDLKGMVTINYQSSYNGAGLKENAYVAKCIYDKLYPMDSGFTLEDNFDTPGEHKAYVGDNVISYTNADESYLTMLYNYVAVDVACKAEKEKRVFCTATAPNGCLQVTVEDYAFASSKDITASIDPKQFYAYDYDTQKCDFLDSKKRDFYNLLKVGHEDSYVMFYFDEATFELEKWEFSSSMGYHNTGHTYYELYQELTNDKMSNYVVSIYKDAYELSEKIPAKIEKDFDVQIKEGDIVFNNTNSALYKKIKEQFLRMNASGADDDEIEEALTKYTGADVMTNAMLANAMKHIRMSEFWKYTNDKRGE